MKKAILVIIVLLVGIIGFRSCFSEGDVYNTLKVQWLKVNVSSDVKTINKALDTTNKVMKRKNLSEKEKYLTEMVYYTLLANQKITAKILEDGENANPDKYKNTYTQLMSQIGTITLVFTDNEYELASAQDLKKIADLCKQSYNSL